MLVVFLITNCVVYWRFVLHIPGNILYRPAMLRQSTVCRLLISGRATNTNP